MDHAQILPRLFVGSHPEGIEDIERLRQESQVTAVLNLQTDEDMWSLPHGWQALAARYQTSGIELLRISVTDGDTVDIAAKLPACVRALDRLLSTGHRVYLHCTAGVGRSPTVAVAYLHWCWGWDLEVAAAYVKQRRVCSPNLEAIHRAH